MEMRVVFSHLTRVDLGEVLASTKPTEGTGNHRWDASQASVDQGGYRVQHPETRKWAVPAMEVEKGGWGSQCRQKGGQEGQGYEVLLRPSRDRMTQPKGPKKSRIGSIL